MWELDHREGWAEHQRKNCCFQTVALEKILESPLDFKETKQGLGFRVRIFIPNPKGNQSWLFTGRTDTEAPIFCPSDVKSHLTGKDPNARKDRGQKEKGAAEDEMVRWYHRLNGLEIEHTQGDSEGQGSLACRHPWGSKELDTTEKRTTTMNEKVILDLHYGLTMHNDVMCDNKKKWEGWICTGI